jgi:hypothetical protein
MREDNENIVDRYFREGLDELNIIPPPDVWNNIAEQLPKKKNNRKIVIWVAVAASVSLFAAISGWNFFRNDRAGKNLNNTAMVATATVNENNTSNANKNTQQENTLKQSQINTTPNGGATKRTLSANTSQKNDKQSRLREIKENYAIASAQNTASGNRTTADDPEVAVQEYKTSQSPVALQENTIKAKSNYNSFAGSNSTATSAEKMSEIASIDIKPFHTPNVYGKIGLDKPVVKADVAPVYENLYAMQDIEEPKEKTDRWAIGGQLAPLYSYRNISEVDAPGLSKSSMNNIEKGIVSYASGVLVGYEASSRLTFQTGVYYMKMGQETDNVSNFAKPVAKSATYLSYSLNDINQETVTNSIGTIDAPAADLYFDGSTENSGKQSYGPDNLALSRADEVSSKKNIEQTFEFIEVPFLAKYKIIDRKIDLHLIGGLSTHVLVNNKTKLISDDNSVTEGKTSNVETMNYSSSVGFGVAYKLRKNLMLNVEPTFKYYLNSFNTNSVVKTHPYAFGIYSGISFKF